MNKNVTIVCFMDINRMASQSTRGGGLICLESTYAWNIMKNVTTANNSVICQGVISTQGVSGDQL